MANFTPLQDVQPISLYEPVSPQCLEETHAIPSSVWAPGIVSVPISSVAFFPQHCGVSYFAYADEYSTKVRGPFSRSPEIS